MASWRAPGSISEAPGLDFGGSGLDFPRFWPSQAMPEGISGWQTLRHRRVLHHWEIRGREVAEILPSHTASASNACASASWQRWARIHEVGGRRCPPPGGFQWNCFKIEKNLVRVWSGCGLQSLLKLKIFKNGVLEASRLDFGGPGPRFWRV